MLPCLLASGCIHSPWAVDPLFCSSSTAARWLLVHTPVHRRGGWEQSGDAVSAAWRRQTGGRAGPALAVPLVSQTPARFRGEVPCERQRQLSLLIYDWAAVVTRRNSRDSFQWWKRGGGGSAAAAVRPSPVHLLLADRFLFANDMRAAGVAIHQRPWWWWGPWSPPWTRLTRMAGWPGGPTGRKDGASRQALDIRPVSISFFPFASGAIDYCSTAENRETHKFRDWLPTCATIPRFLLFIFDWYLTRMSALLLYFLRYLPCLKIYVSGLILHSFAVQTKTKASFLLLNLPNCSSLA